MSVKAKISDPEQDVVTMAPSSERQLVLAGPGTGKTETVAKRLAHLLHSGVNPAQILVLSFSRSAVKTLTRRLERFISEYPDQLDEFRHLAIRTFDSWTFRMLRLIGHVPGDLLRGSHDDNISRLVGEINGPNRVKVAERLASIRHIIVDEFQDLSGVRGGLVLALFELLAAHGTKKVGFTVLGDEAQAIYGFTLRVAEDGEFSELTAARLLSLLKERYQGELKTIELKTNHRATEQLASMTLALRSILARPISGKKKLEAMQKLVERIPAIEGELSVEVVGIDRGGPSAILTRTNGEVMRVAQKLAGYEVAPPRVLLNVRTTGRPAGVPAWVGATLGRAKADTVTRSQFGKIYSHLFGGERTAAAAAVGMPPEASAWSNLARGTDAGSGASAISLATLRARLGWADLLPDDEGEVSAGIHVMTVHQSKGMEFAEVSILESDFGDHPPESEDEATEAANVMFVGVSRAGKSLSRVPDGATYKPLRRWTFAKGGRARWGDWHHGWINMEMGVPGDIDPMSFVDLSLHGSIDAVRAVQTLLMSKSIELRGHKVMLCKRAIAGAQRKFIYGIHLQTGKEPGQLLGATTEQLTFDLLSKLHGPKYKYPLPQRIFNLRICEVGTTTYIGESPAGIAQDWAQSGIWLGITFYGTGDFQTPKRG